MVFLIFQILFVAQWLKFPAIVKVSIFWKLVALKHIQVSVAKIKENLNMKELFLLLQLNPFRIPFMEAPDKVNECRTCANIIRSWFKIALKYNHIFLINKSLSKEWSEKVKTPAYNGASNYGS